MKTAWLRVNNNVRFNVDKKQIEETLDTTIEELHGHISGREDATHPNGQDDNLRCVNLPDDSSIYGLVEKLDQKFKSMGIKVISHISSAEPPPMLMMDNSPVPQALLDLVRG